MCYIQPLDKNIERSLESAEPFDALRHLAGAPEDGSAIRDFMLARPSIIGRWQGWDRRQRREVIDAFLAVRRVRS